MLTGIVNQSSLGQLLQSIAQRRKQGDLEVTVPDGLIKISFIQGKIVEYRFGDAVPAREVAKLLVDARRLPVDPSFEGTSYGELQTFVQAAIPDPGDAANVLAAAIKKRLYNALHAFAIEGTVPWGFRVGGVDVDRALAANISVSQLLLDWSEVEEAGNKFEKIFPDETAVLERDAAASMSGSAHADLLLCLETSRTINELESLSLVPYLSFQQSLISMLESGLIRIGAVPAAPSSEQQSSAVDSATAVEPGAAPEVTQETEPQAPVKERRRRARGIRLSKPKLVESDSMPHIIALALLISSIVLPFFFWAEAFTLF